MDTTKIEIVLRALELGSLTRAAAEYEYSPSAVSQMVTALEAEIGTKIVNRTYSGVEIAEGREELVALMSQIVTAKNRLIKAAAEKSDGRDTLNIATYSSISKNILPGAVKAYRRLHPTADINIIVTDRLIDSFRKGSADIVLGEQIKNIEAVWDSVLTDPYVAILPKAFAGSENSITREELLKNKFILARDRNISSYMQGRGTKDSFSNNSNDDSSVIELVRAEMGVSILSRLAVLNADGIETKKLIPSLTRELGFMYRKTLFTEKPHAEAFVRFLKEYMGKENLA